MPTLHPAPAHRALLRLGASVLVGVVVATCVASFSAAPAAYAGVQAYGGPCAPDQLATVTAFVGSGSASVECTSAGNVRQITVAERTDFTPPPGADLSSLPAVDALYISNNAGTGGLSTFAVPLPPTLKTLWLYNDGIGTFTSALPPTLQEIYLRSNALTSIPALPEGLKKLTLSENRLTSLPTDLPGSLLELHAWGNPIASLPGTLPPSLTDLTLTYDGTAFSTQLPPTLRVFSIDAKNLTQFNAALPVGLTEAKLSYFKTDDFNVQLPPGLQKLTVFSSTISTFSSSLPSSLTYLYYGYNTTPVFSSQLPDGLSELFLYSGDLAWFTSPVPASVLRLTLGWNLCGGTIPQKPAGVPDTNWVVRLGDASFCDLKLSPWAHPNGGSYTAPQTVTLRTIPPTGTIRFTLDGSDPTASSNLYSGPVTIATSTTLKSRTFFSDRGPSRTTQDVYVISGSPSCASSVLGDVTGNGAVDQGDAALLANSVADIPAYAATNYPCITRNGDVTRSGAVDQGDAAKLANFVAGVAGITIP